MAGEYQLKNELETDWKLHDDTWKTGVDKNWKKIDWRLAPNVLDILPDSSTLPLTPAAGDAYLIENVNQIWIWNNVTVIWDKINLINPFLFYNQADSKFKKWVASIITDLETGVGSAVPIGAVLPFEDYGVLTLPVGYWWCDGSVINAPGSPIDAQISHDMSGIYPGAYGTPGGSDMPGAASDPATIGNPLHEIDIQHQHTHSHTHSLASHTHNEGSLEAMIGINLSDDVIQVRRSGTGFPGTGLGTDRWATSGIGNDTINDDCSYVVGVEGTTSGPSTNTSGAASTSTTNNQLSPTQNIQPETRRFKWIRRVL